MRSLNIDTKHACFNPLGVMRPITCTPANDKDRFFSHGFGLDFHVFGVFFLEYAK